MDATVEITLNTYVIDFSVSHPIKLRHQRTSPHGLRFEPGTGANRAVLKAQGHDADFPYHKGNLSGL